MMPGNTGYGRRDDEAGATLRGSLDPADVTLCTLR
jgi:hypothetical protein